MSKTETKQRVIVVGGGYAGTMAALRIAGRARGRAEVALVNPEDVLVQRLRLHELAVGHRVESPALSKLVGRRPVALIKGAATAIDPARGELEVLGDEGVARHRFDRLVLATGSRSDVSVPGVAEYAHTCADWPSAARLRAALSALPEAAIVAVAGAGLTGLEVASEIAEARPDLRIRLVGNGELGGWLAPRARAYLAEALARLNVEVRAGVRVSTVERDRMLLADGSRVAFDLAIWCGGFVATPLARESGLATDERGAVLVDAAMRSCSHPQVLAVGDAASPPPLPNGAAFRPTCQAGMPTGAHAADTIVAELRGREPEPFDFGYVGQPISLGRRDALIQFTRRDDTPIDRMLTGRVGARYKRFVSVGPITGLNMARRMPGLIRWPSARAPRATDHAFPVERTRASA
jgi:NADH dehydrogenase FAD-containing subunit